MKKSATLLVVIVLLFVFAGVPAGATQQAQKPGGVADELAPAFRKGGIKVGWCPPGISPYYDLILNGVKQAIGEIGSERIDLVVKAPSTKAGDAEQAIILNDWVDKDYDAIIVSAINRETLAPIFERAAQNGIPIVEFDIPAELADSEHSVCTVGASPYKAGRLLGEWAAKYYQNGGTVMAAVLEASTGQHMDLRANGFKDAVKGSDIEVAASAHSNPDAKNAFETSAELLSAYPDISLIYAVSDGMAAGAVQAAMQGAAQADVIAYGLTEDGLKDIKEGRLLAGVYCDNQRTGYNSLMAAFNFSAEGKLVPRAMEGEPLVVTAENAGDITLG